MVRTPGFRGSWHTARLAFRCAAVSERGNGIIPRTTLMIGLAIAPSGMAAVVLNPPEIIGMKIIGRMGTTQNWYTTGMALNGQYLYCGVGVVGGLKTLDVSDPTNM